MFEPSRVGQDGGSERRAVDVIKDSRWLGLVVHEPGAPAIAVDARRTVQNRKCRS